MNRSTAIDLIKALAAQVIVWHHFVLYTPMAEVLSEQWPALIGWLDAHGRLAVQPFLVIGGYLGAQSMARRDNVRFWPLVGQRYWRLMPALWVSLCLVVGVTWAMGEHLQDAGWASPLPDLGVFLAHVFMLQDLLGVASISAGAWYIAVDLQLFALLVLLVKISTTCPPRLAMTALSAMVTGLTLASIHVFSRQPLLDIWAIYFFSAYGLGVLVAWSPMHRVARMGLALTVVLLVLDAVLDPRPRPVLALATAGVLWAWAQVRGEGIKPWADLLRRLGDGSYGLFVSHFAVILLVTAVWNSQNLSSTQAAWLCLGAAWLLAQVVGHLVDQISQGLRRWLRPTPT